MRKRGVTLVELIVVMVIIGIAATLIAPNIGAWLPNYRLRSATRDIISTMRIAQMKAVSTNLTYQVSFTINPASYILQYQNTAGTWVNEGVAQNLPTGISISAITLAGNKAQFNPNSTSSSGSVTLRNNRGVEKKISLTSSTGRVRVE